MTGQRSWDVAFDASALFLMAVIVWKRVSSCRCTSRLPLVISALLGAAVGLLGFFAGYRISQTLSPRISERYSNSATAMRKLNVTATIDEISSPPYYTRSGRNGEKGIMSATEMRTWDNLGASTLHAVAITACSVLLLFGAKGFARESVPILASSPSTYGLISASLAYFSADTFVTAKNETRIGNLVAIQTAKIARRAGVAWIGPSFGTGIYPDSLLRNSTPARNAGEDTIQDTTIREPALEMLPLGREFQDNLDAGATDEPFESGGGQDHEPKHYQHEQHEDEASRQKRKNTAIMLTHHVVCLASLAAVLITGNGHPHVLWMMCTELTTPFVNLRWWLEACDRKESGAYLANGVAMTLAWLVARILLFFAYFAFVARDACATVSAVPVSYVVVMIAVPLFLLALNAFWFSRIWRGLRKALSRGT